MYTCPYLFRTRHFLYMHACAAEVQPSFTMAPHQESHEQSERVVSAAEVAKHACFERGKEDVWIVLDLDKRGQRVFDVTYYLDEHPGGPEILQEVAGLSGWEATDEFVAVGHSEDASFDAERFCIGRLEGGAHRDASGTIHPVASATGAVVPTHANDASGTASAASVDTASSEAPVAAVDDTRLADNSGWAPWTSIAALVAAVAVGAFVYARRRG